MQSLKKWRHMVVFPGRKHQACRSIQNRLQPADGWKTSQRRAAVVQSYVNQRYDQWDQCLLWKTSPYAVDLTKCSKAGRHCSWNVWLHGNVGVDVNTQITDRGSSGDTVVTNPSPWLGICCWRRLVEHQRSSVLALLRSSRLLLIHDGYFVYTSRHLRLKLYSIRRRT